MNKEEASLWRENAETRNDDYMEHFNNRMRFFNVNRCPTFSTIDYTGTDRKGRRVNIETKVRECEINTYDTLFIEKKKYDALKEGWDKGIKPLFINFMRDGFHVFLVDLTQYFTGERKIESKFVNIANYGYQREDQQVLRYLIPPRDGVYYEFDKTTEKYKRLW